MQSQKSYKKEAGGSESERDWKMLCCWLLKMEEEEGTGQGMQVVSRSWKREGNEIYSRASRRNTALPTYLDFLTQES